jgi:TonB family protein
MLALLCLAGSAPAFGQDARPFDGITLMVVHHEKIHEALSVNPGFRGDPRKPGSGQPSFIMTVVSGDRGYASLTKGYDFRAKCMTFIQPDTLDGETIVIGSGNPEWISGREFGVVGVGGDRKVCREFQLKRLSPDQALFKQGDLEFVLPITASFPIREIDWSSPLIDRFRHEPYGLGPVTINDVRRSFNDMDFSGAARIMDDYGQLRPLRQTGPNPSGGNWQITAIADVHRLRSEGRSEIVYLYSQRTPSSIVKEFGPPSLEIMSGGVLRIWAHDLDGRLLKAETDSHHPCLERAITYNIKDRLGPPEVGAWGCGVVAVHQNDHFHVYHGHALARYILYDRLNDADIIMRVHPPAEEEAVAAVVQPVAQPVGAGDYKPVMVPAPVYPAHALARGLEGYVTVKFTVTRIGTVKDIVVVDSSSSLFERYAIDAATMLSYEPRIVDGTAVEVSGVSYTFSFEISE